MEKGSIVSWNATNNVMKVGYVIETHEDFTLVAVDQRNYGSAQAQENAKLWADERPVVLVATSDLFVKAPPRPKLPENGSK